MNKKGSTAILLIALLWLLLIIPTIAQSIAPPARAYYSMSYDAESNVVVVFSGLSEVGISGNEYQDTWAFTPSSNVWQNMSPIEMPPGGEGRGWTAYDSKNDVIILFGGWGIPQTWAYNFNNNNWTNLQPSVSPPGRDAHTMVYDSQSERMIIFGGRPDILQPWEFLHDTWTYDYDTNTWSNETPDVSPEGRWYHSMSYDSNADRVILFGGGSDQVITVGQDYAGVLNDTWVFDLESGIWDEVTPSVSPEPRTYSAIAYDSSVNRTILYGGSLGAGGGAYDDVLYDDTWSYNYDENTWTEMNPTTNPGQRMRHSMVYADNTSQIVMFGGQKEHENNVFNSETWVYDFELNMWTEVAIPTNPFDPTLVVLVASISALVLIVLVVYIKRR